MKSNNRKRWAILMPLVTAVGHSWRRRINHELTNQGLSASTAVPLVVLLRNESTMRQCDLAEKLGIEGPSLVRILDGLEESKFIERKPDSTDRRARRLILTESGREMAEQVEIILADFRATMLADADPDDVDAAIGLLTFLANRLGISPLTPTRI
jgi:MarR family transcriptional regulator for hemolysin